jgi:hypothetical protein
VLNELGSLANQKGGSAIQATFTIWHFGFYFARIPGTNICGTFWLCQVGIPSMLILTTGRKPVLFA